MVDYPTVNQDRGRSRPARLIVLHSTETQCHTARSVAQAFQNPARRASAHWVVGTDAVVSCVAEADTAWAAPGANTDGIQIEMCGFADRTDWTTGAGRQVVVASAAVLAGVSRRTGIPLIHLTDAQIISGASGVITHAQVSRIWKKSDHWDPGNTFPISTLLALARGEQDTTTTEENELNNEQAAQLANTAYLVNGPLAQAIGRLDTARVQTAAELAAIKTALAAVAKGSNVDGAAITEAVNTAVKDAMAGVEITLTTKEA